MSETLAGGELRIHLLGQPRFSWRGEAYPFHSRPRSLALVAFLLLHRGAHITRDALAFTLWPEDTEEEARGKLRRHLYQANSALPPTGVPYVVAKGDVISWNDEAQTWCDVDEFERCCADEARWPDAMELYDGDLVPAIYDDWIFPIRERLRRDFISTMERLLIRARNQRDFGRAIAYAARILNHDPWREDVLRHLASVRYESGDRAGAIREIDAFARRLMDEMSVEAMPETTALRTLMLHGKGLPDGGVPTIPLDAASRVPFVGRSSELDRLAGAWRRAACGRGEVLFVSGEAGIGKTRLLGELALTATLEGGRVFRGTTSPPEETPYQSIVEGLREALPFLGSADIRPIWLSALSVLLPELSLRQSDLTALPMLDAARERSRLLEALASTLHGLSRQRPLLLVLDDIQWAGEATLAAIEYLARRTAAMPALIVATYRSDHDQARGVGHLRRKLQRENLIGHLSLGGLSTDALCELARSLPELAGRADATGVEVHEITGGNPLFAIELLRERAEGGVTSPTLAAMIAARTARMAEPARKVAEVASVAGPTVDVDLLREVSALPEDVVLDAVSELLERRLLREVGRVRFAFVFGHQLIASAIYEEVEQQRRMQLHRRTALAIEKLFGDRDEFAAPLAYHYDRAAESERAAYWYLRCAEHAFALFANEEALTSAARGFELTQDPSLQCTLLGLRERVLGRLGNREAQRTTIDQLERLAIGEDARADVLWRNASLAHAQRDLSAEAECLRAYSAYALARGDRARNAAAESAVARNLLLRSRYEEAARAAESAVEAWLRLR
jgi:DNA-binding SARP family transcriptional activator